MSKRTDPETDRPAAGLTRRQFGWQSLGLLALAGSFGAGRTARAAHAPLVDTLPANAPLLAGVQYVPKSVKEGQRCANCVLYRATDASHGKCALFQQGAVPAEAWCMSWGPKPA